MLEFQIYILVDKIVKIRNQTKVKHWLFNRKAGNLIKNKYCKNQIHSYPKRGFSQSRQHIFNISIRDSIHRIHLAECRRAVTSTWQPVACLVASTRQSVAVRVPTPCRLSLSRDIHLAGQHAPQISIMPFARPGEWHGNRILPEDYYLCKSTGLNTTKMIKYKAWHRSWKQSLATELKNIVASRCTGTSHWDE